MKKSFIALAFLLFIKSGVYAQTNYEPNVTVSTFAGMKEIRGHEDGQGNVASFNSPSGIVFDASGNAYIGDQANNLIRKITPEGIVSTFAGSTSSGSSDGQGTSARFFWPVGMAIDGSGNLYVADQINSLIRKISPDGWVSTFAGSGLSTSTDGQGTNASFSGPQGVAVDDLGNVYVADSGNNLIRKITPAGLVSTLAGSTTQGFTDGQGTAARFSKPTGITIDADNNLYVADFSNNKIRKITATGMVSTLAGSGFLGNTDGQGTSASFNNPSGVVADAKGNIYVADYENNMIRKITPAGIVTTLAGTTERGSTDGNGASARFYWPYGIGINASGILHVVDSGNEEIRKINAGIETSILNSANTSSITLFPNPAKNVLTITLTEVVYGTLSIFDIQGSLLLTKPIADKQIKLSTESYDNGIYVIHIVSENASYTSRVVIAK